MDPRGSIEHQSVRNYYVLLGSHLSMIFNCKQLVPLTGMCGWLTFFRVLTRSFFSAVFFFRSAVFFFTTTDSLWSPYKEIPSTS